MLSFADDAAADRDGAVLVVDGEILRPDDADLAHLARDERRVRRGAPRRREDARRRAHAPDVFRARFDAHEDDLFPAAGPLLGVGRVEDRLARGRSRSRVDALRDEPSLPERPILAGGVEDGPQELVELFRLDPADRVFLRDEPLADHVDRDLDRGEAGALARARLEDPETAVLYRKLEILHVRVMDFERPAHLLELGVDRGHLLLEGKEVARPFLAAIDGLRRPDAGDDVLSLRLHEVFPVEDVLARGRISGEGDAGARIPAEVSEHHRLDVDRRPPVVRDAVEATVGLGAIVVPRVEDGADRLPELLHGVGRELDPEGGADHVPVAHDEIGEIGDAELDVFLDAALALFRGEYDLEGIVIVLVDRFQPEHDVAVHLDEAPVAVVREPFVPGSRGERLHRLVVETEVQHRVHHAGHAGARSGPDREEQRIASRAELRIHLPFDPFQVLRHLGLESGGIRAAVRVEMGAYLGRYRESGGHRDAEVRHLREPGPLSPEKLLHGAVPLGLAAAEEIDMLGLHGRPPIRFLINELRR